MVARRLMLTLFAALTLSGGFTFWLSRRVGKVHTVAAARRQYVVSANNVGAGEQIPAGTLKLEDWGGPTALDGGFTRVEDVAGRLAAAPLSAGQPIVARQLAAAGGVAGLTVRIPEGMRAVSLRLNEVTGVSGFLFPGTRVDVLVTCHKDDVAQATTIAVLQDAEVLAAGQKMQADAEGKATTVGVVTLLLKPEDAQKVVLASSLGEVYFVLRNDFDRDATTHPAARMAALNGVNETAGNGFQRTRRDAAAIREQPYQVETTAGTKQSVETFQ